MSERLNEYMKQRGQTFETLKRLAELSLKEGMLTEKMLIHFMAEAFRCGRYVGHCQGEKYANELYEQYKALDSYDY